MKAKLKIGFLLLCFFNVAQAVSDVKVEIPLIGQNCNERVAKIKSVPGRLKIPEGDGVYPAVVIFHSNAGVIGVGDNYANRLVEKGFITLEVDSYTPRFIRNGNDNNAPTPCDRLTDAWSALYFLSKNPKVNIKKVGNIGLSSGGVVSLLLARGAFPKGMNSPDEGIQAIRKMRYKKFVVLYPACANVLYDENLNWMRNPNRPRKRPTDGELLLIVGTKDDMEFDAKKDCPKVIDEWSQFNLNGSLNLIEGATHAFDWPNPPPPSFSRFGKAGKGTSLTMTYSQKDTLNTERQIIEFFQEFNR